MWFQQRILSLLRWFCLEFLIRYLNQNLMKRSCRTSWAMICLVRSEIYKSWTAQSLQISNCRSHDFEPACNRVLREYISPVFHIFPGISQRSSTFYVQYSKRIRFVASLWNNSAAIWFGTQTSHNFPINLNLPLLIQSLWLDFSSSDKHFEKFHVL